MFKNLSVKICFGLKVRNIKWRILSYLLNNKISSLNSLAYFLQIWSHFSCGTFFGFSLKYFLILACSINGITAFIQPLSIAIYKVFVQLAEGYYIYV